MSKPIEKIVLEIVKEADLILKKKISGELSVDFVDIFPRSEKERIELTKEIKKLGREISKTGTGEIYLLNRAIITKFGQLSLVKIRIFDNSRPQRGAPDFKVKNYSSFKKKYLKDKAFGLIIRKDYEMLELKEKGKNILIYFPSETLSKSLGFYS